MSKETEWKIAHTLYCGDDDIRDVFIGFLIITVCYSIMTKWEIRGIHCIAMTHLNIS